MDTSGNQRWLRTAILLGVVYLVVGIAFGALAGAAASTHMRVAWRLAAWLASAAAFGAHIGYEHFRLRNPPLSAAWHAAVAVGLGAFALAVAANVHAYWAAASHQRGRLLLALVIWPALAGVPAFVVALAATAVLARTRRST
jgi:hypothetical protein